MTSQHAVAVAELRRTLFLTSNLKHLENRANVIYTTSTDWAKWAVMRGL